MVLDMPLSGHFILQQKAKKDWRKANEQTLLVAAA